MNLNINYYNRDLPKVGDVVTVCMKEPSNDIIETTIEEYPSFIGIFQIADLTNKKKIRSIRQYIKKTPVPAEITDIDEKTKIVSLSRRYLRDLEDKYQKYYSEKLRLCNIAKNVHRNFKEDNFNDIFKNIIYPINDLIYQDLDENEIPEIFNIIEEKFKNNDFINFGKYNDFINKVFNKLFAEKKIKLSTDFSIMSSQSVNNIISLFEELKNKYPKVKFRLKAIPTYFIESIGMKDNEEKLHQEILDYIQSNSSKYNIAFKPN